MNTTPTHCLRCGRRLRPAPSIPQDSDVSYVRLLPCICSQTAWLLARANGTSVGESYQTYVARMNVENPPPEPQSSRRPHESRGSAASNACFGAL